MINTNAHSDFYAHIRFCIVNKKKDFLLVNEKTRLLITESFYKQGFVSSFKFVNINEKKFIKVELKTFEGKLTINSIRLISTISRPLTTSLKNIKDKKRKSETLFLLTSKGFLFDFEALQLNTGGFILYSLN